MRKKLIVPLFADAPIWIHVSSGEIEYAKALIRKLEIDHPLIPIFLTYFSPSAEKLLPEGSNQLKIMPLPFDTRRSVLKVLEAVRPRAILYARTDVWPELSHQSFRKGIPSLLFACTISEKSSKHFFLLRPFQRGIFRNLSEIQFVSSSDLEQFGRIGFCAQEDKIEPGKDLSRKQARHENRQRWSEGPTLRICGDSRYDQAFYRLDHPKLNIRRPDFLGDQVFVAGSTWPEDENFLLPAVDSLFSGNFKMMIAPHEVGAARIEKLQNYFESKNISVVRFSRLKTEGDLARTYKVIIVDQVGVLADLYTWGNFAFVGGSFKAKVHSVMEALVAGLPVIVGPFHLNNREAIRYQSIRIGDLPLVTSASDSNAILETLSKFISKKVPKDEIQSLLKKEIGATDFIFQFLLDKKLI